MWKGTWESAGANAPGMLSAGKEDETHGDATGGCGHW